MRKGEEEEWRTEWYYWMNFFTWFFWMEVVETEGLYLRRTQLPYGALGTPSQIGPVARGGLVSGGAG